MFKRLSMLLPRIAAICAMSLGRFTGKMEIEKSSRRSGRFAAMSQFLRAVFLIAFALSGVSAKAGDQWHFRDVLFEVRDPDGKPTPGVKVHLMGVERFAMGPGDGDNKNWNFVADTKGRFTARFGVFRSMEYAEKMHEEMPGYGGFYMVAEFPGTAGGVSPYLKNAETKGERLLSEGETEWRGFFVGSPLEDPAAAS
jgi:hypothetical protein